MCSSFGWFSSPSYSEDEGEEKRAGESEESRKEARTMRREEKRKGKD
jgi:hypothetical protein